ncbi:MAG: hypothetical protein M3Y50_18545, partial [Acidobacteriota bacterium]|nr:hypothetical protein [Acidobacteriota bacterium]
MTRVRALLGATLLGGCFAAASAQTMRLAEPPAPLLPQALRTGAAHEAGTGVPSWAGADGPVLVEDGIERYERGTVPNGAGPAGTVTVYQFVDATGAVAAYDYLRKSAPYGMRGGVSVVLAKVQGSRASAESLLRTVQTGLPKVGGPKGLAPLLPTFLPTQGLEQETVHYALGPEGYRAMGGVLPPGIVGFDKAAEVVTAKYAG